MQSIELFLSLSLQLILATMPDSKHGKLPSIVTDSNIQLLFDIQKKVYTLIFFKLFYN